jgi:DNA polymerase III delta subunit
MTLKLALIIDKSQAYLNFQKSRILDDWKIKDEKTKNISKLTDAGGITLFGESLASILRLETPELLKEFVADLEREVQNNNISNYIKDGLIVLCDQPRTGTKKLEKIFQDLNAEICIAAGDKKENISTSEKILQEINLNPSARTYLLAYVGDDYQSLVPLIKTISSLSRDKQLLITEEDIYIRLPQKPGSVPPWNLEKPLFAGDINKTIDIFRRVSANSSFLVILAVLKNKIQLAYRVSSLLENNQRISDEAIAKATGANPRSLYFIKQNHRKYGHERLQKASEIIALTETNVKGGSGASPMIMMEKMLVELALLFS